MSLAFSLRDYGSDISFRPFTSGEDQDANPWVSLPYMAPFGSFMRIILCVIKALGIFFDYLNLSGVTF